LVRGGALYYRKGKRKKETSMNDERRQFFNRLIIFNRLLRDNPDGWASRGCPRSTVPGCIGMAGTRQPCGMTLHRAGHTNLHSPRHSSRTRSNSRSGLPRPEQTNAQMQGETEPGERQAKANPRPGGRSRAISEERARRLHKSLATLKHAGGTKRAPTM